jgi:hypothetical protein
MDKTKLMRVLIPSAIILLFIIVGVTVYLITRTSSNLIIRRGVITVYYVDEVPGSRVSGTPSGRRMTEENEKLLFNSFVDIFHGTVLETRNIAYTTGMDAGGWPYPSHMGIIITEVNEVIRGNKSAGDKVTILSWYPISPNMIFNSGGGSASEIRAGMSGLFLPLEIYEHDGIYSEGYEVYYNEFADYWSNIFFIDTPEGLLSDFMSQYHSLNNQSTLEDIKALIAYYESAP